MYFRSFAVLVLTVTAVLGARVFADLPINTLTYFTRDNGANPNTGVIVSGNTLYGTTYAGGAYGYGTVFSLPITGGTPTVLGTFDDVTHVDLGAQPFGTLTLSGNTLYGTTTTGSEPGGGGSVFSITTAGGAPTVVASFNGTNGLQPFGGVTLSGTTLYGLTTRGGPSDYGVVYSAPISGGAPKVLGSFGGSTPQIPVGNLVLSGGTLYGMTRQGGTHGDGSIFSVPVSGGPPTTLVDFAGTNGTDPASNLILVGNTLYGTTGSGGAFGFGTVFSVPLTGGAPTVLASFNNDTNGGFPAGGLVFTGGTLYGTTSIGGANNQGTIFAIPVTGGTPTALASFSEGRPTGALAFSGSTLYGTTIESGPSGFGAVFSLSLPSSVSWTQAVSGNWSSSSNWSPATVPQSINDAHFSTGSTTPYTVSLTGASAANNLTVQGNSVTLNTSGNTLSVSGSLIVAEIGGRNASFTLHGAGAATDLLSASGGLFVGTASSSPNTVSMTVDGIQIIGNVTNYARLQFANNGVAAGPNLNTVTGTVTNAGEIRTGSSGSSGPNVTAGNAVTIKGNFLQSASGVLTMNVGAGAYDQLHITGTANLDGTLNIARNTSWIPTVGTQLPLISYSNLIGRFSALQGSAINDASGKTTNEFFGLLYGANTINLITLPVPQRPNGTSLAQKNPGASGLVLVAHGLTGSPADWASKMATDIKNAIPNSNAGNWDVATIDWSSYANVSALAGAANGNDIGESLANWMRETGVNYSAMHLVGHSAGGWLINGITDNLKAHGGSTYVVQTYLDAYNPAKPPINGYAPLSFPTLGAAANYAEQYYNSGTLGLDGSASGVVGLPLVNAANFNVSSFYNGFINLGIAAHSFPHDWYDATVNGPLGVASGGGYGFAQAPEFSSTLPAFGNGGLPNRGSDQDLPGGIQFSNARYDPPVSLLGPSHVTSGTVYTDGQNGVVLSSSTSPSSPLLAKTAAQSAAASMTSPSGAPAILTDEVNLASSANMVTLSGRFTSNGHGLLTGYLDGQEIFQVLETDTQGYPWSFSDLYLGNQFSAGINTLMLRLDSYDNLDSAVDISSIQLGFATAVPEPPTAVVWAMMVSIFGLRRHSSRRRAA